MTTTNPIEPNTIPVKKTYTYYHAGPLFTLADLSTNIALSSLIATLSHNRFQPILPQDLEPRPIPGLSASSPPPSTSTPAPASQPTPHTIRDTDLTALLTCDLALFIYDGAELDAGTVVEYMYAKAADIPSVILRTDFRGAGDQGQMDEGDKWNLMSSNWPRTRGVRVDSMVGYKEGLASVASEQVRGAAGGQQGNRRAAEGLLRSTAEKVVAAMEEVVALPPRLPRELRGQVYEWLALMPGLRDGGDEGNVQWARGVLEGKVGKGLL